MTRPGAAALVRPRTELTERLPTLAVDIERVTESPGHVAGVVDEIARESFTEGGFSVDEELTRPWSRIWLARVRDPDEVRVPHDVAGFLIAWHVADEVHVLNVATTPVLRRRGVGRALMNVALDYARSHGVRIVILEVRRSNRAAIRMYRSLGFSALGIRPKYYSDDGEDALEMMVGIDPATGELLPGRDEVRIDP